MIAKKNHSSLWIRSIKRFTSPINAVNELRAQAGKIENTVVSKKFQL